MTQRRSGSGSTIAQSIGQRSPGGGPFRIQAAAELCGVSAATMRAWERRYGVPVPRRTATAYRLYTPEDVELLGRMRALVESGVAPAQAASALIGSGASGAAGAFGAEEVHVVIDGLELAQNRILAATHRWDGAAIDTELTRLSMLLDAQTLYERVIAPTMVEVGRRWERSELSIAQEHLLSERVELAVRASLRANERKEGPLVLLTCIDAEQHVLGMLGAALRFASNGARLMLLGAMTPPEAVGEAVRTLAPRLVGLSVSVAPARPEPLFRAYARACGATRWVVGGAAADAVRPVVEASGGMVACGSATHWTAHVRDWLRGPR